MAQSNYLTISQAAKILDVHPNTLRNWEKQKKLIPFRDRITKYRHYTYQQIRNYLKRGSLPKIEIKWGDNYAKRARIEELSSVRKTLDALVSQEATTNDSSLDKQLFSLLRQTRASGISIRFIRNLDNPQMKRRAKAMEKLGVKTKNRKITGVTFSIRDKKVVRIEIPNDNNEQRLSLIIHDSKMAKSFSMLFEKLWGKR